VIISCALASVGLLSGY